MTNVLKLQLESNAENENDAPYSSVSYDRCVDGDAVL